MRHLVVGTAGHIDHGKSTVVRALTGTDPDRLKEEKARGITIELGFADLDLGAGRVVSFVDVPGHERFVRHMVAGATGIDAVLLVVAADSGVQPQTREHLAICRLLDVRHGLVALAKIDLVDEDLREVVALELAETLEGTFLENAPVIPISARDGLGLDALREALAGLFARVSPRADTGIARLPIDRSFVLRGFGTVVTGTLASGAIADGDDLEIHPGGARARVRGVQVHHAKVDRAIAGQRTAVNLQGVSTDDVPRGATLSKPGALRSTDRIWARVEWLAHAPDKLRHGGLVRFHQGTGDRGARFRVLGARDDGAIDVELFLDDDALLVPGDRFILRQTAPLDTVGGGVVLDIRPPRAKAARGESATLSMPGEDAHAGVGVRLARAGSAGVEVATLAGELGVDREEIERRLAGAAAAGVAIELAGRWFALARIDAVEAAVESELEALHRAEPLRPGHSRERLRAAACPDMAVDAWRAVLERMAARGAIRLDGERLASASHEVVLSPRDQAIFDRIVARFVEGGLEPPDLDDVVREQGGEAAERLVELLIDRGLLVRLRDGRPFAADALDGMVRTLAEHARTSKTIEVGTFKDLFGVTRKNAIPLLEYLDERRVTRRAGNVRQILVE